MNDKELGMKAITLHISYDLFNYTIAGLLLSCWVLLAERLSLNNLKFKTPQSKIRRIVSKTSKKFSDGFLILLWSLLLIVASINNTLHSPVPAIFGKGLLLVYH